MSENITSAATEPTSEFLVARLHWARERVAAACKRAGRNPGDVRLLAVSKTVPAEVVRSAYAAGWRCFGENRPQELRRKLDAAATWPEVCDLHMEMIGNLQRNKINYIVDRVDLLHSLSSVHLARAVSERCVARATVLPALLEVNVSGEETKSGFSPAQLLLALDELMELPGIALKGLMTMAPARDPERARATFEGLRLLAERARAHTGLALSELSCGMSDDFELAVEEGSTVVRLGRCVFDPAWKPANIQ